MASYTSNTISGYYLQLDVSESSIDIASNTSVVSWALYMRASSNYTQSNQWSYTCSVNGTVVSSSSNFTLNFPSVNSWFTMASGSLTVAHNADGAKSVAVSASFTGNGHNYGPNGTMSLSGTFALATIPRASSCTLGSATVALDGSATQTVTISRASTSFTHTVDLLAPDGTVMATQTGVATSCSFTPTQAAWLAKVPNSTSASASVRVTTMNGSTQIGSPVTVPFSVTIPASVVPSVGNPTATRTGQTAVAAYVQGKSGATIAFASAVAGSGATLTGWSIAGPDGEASGPGAASGTLAVATLQATGTQTYTVTVTDSRGQTVTKTVSVTVYAYAAPTLTGMSAYRSASNGTANPAGGTYLRTLASAGYSTVNNLNTVTLGVAWKLASAGSYPANTAFVAGTALVIGGGNVTIGDSWNVRWQVTDKFTTVETVLTIPAAAALIDVYDPGGGGALWIGLGKRAEAAGLDIGLNTRIRGELAIDGGIPAIQIPASADLNDYTTPGSYICNANANATTALHFPVASAAGLLTVDRLRGSTGVWTFQRFTRYSNGDTYYRCQYPTGTWIGWGAPGIDASKLSTGTLPIARIGDGTVTPAKLSALAGMNGAWMEERLTATVYRWTQTFEITTVITSAWGSLFITSQSYSVPVFPSGMTLTAISLSVMQPSEGQGVMIMQGGNTTFWLVRGQAITYSVPYRITAVLYGTKP